MELIKNREEHFMNIALKEAMKAYEEDEIPVGAVIVYQDQIIGRGYNQSQRLKDSTAHAEMIAITSAQNKIGSKYLNLLDTINCKIYALKEDCDLAGLGNKISKGVAIIDYGGFVSLSAEHEKHIPWD